KVARSPDPSARAPCGSPDRFRESYACAQARRRRRDQSPTLRRKDQCRLHAAQNSRADRAAAPGHRTFLPLSWERLRPAADACADAGRLSHRPAIRQRPREHFLRQRSLEARRAVDRLSEVAAGSRPWFAKEMISIATGGVMIHYAASCQNYVVSEPGAVAMG